MLKDISDWERLGYGGKSTLEKEELKSPDGLKYLIKYPRQFNEGVSWEDITELIAAEIGTILGLEMMKVEMVTRNGRRGCLLRNFVDEYDAKMYEEGGALLSGLVEGYAELQESSLKNMDLINAGFQIMKEFSYWEFIKNEFIHMLVFDILIGNQDRHPFNWQILFLEAGPKFSPIYDNGASLGFRFEDEQLVQKTSNVAAMNKYTKNTKVKAGLFEKKSVKATDLLTYIQMHYPEELAESTERLKSFHLDRYKQFIQSLTLLSEAQMEWLQHILPFRRQKILEWIGKEEENHE
ncbi:HipA domain-containing protein [Bacillus badius]|uniref:HipA domain-containing protein n=1 Tax=Bacillus badius TaxID=1455 RepID=UPI002E1AC903|nr:HipA domain-containing protein [Bacillus badius]